MKTNNLYNKEFFEEYGFIRSMNEASEEYRSAIRQYNEDRRNGVVSDIEDFNRRYGLK